MAVVSYYRVSTSDQTIENQRMELSKTYRLDREFFDEGVSGTVPGMERPGFAGMMEWVREGDTLVVVDLDRLGRDSLDVQSNIRELKRKGVNVIVTRLGVDLSTDAGDLLVTIISKIAEMERLKLLERQRAGVARAKAEGKHLGRPQKATAAQVAECRGSGLSISKTAEKLNISESLVKAKMAELKRAAQVPEGVPAK